MTFVFVLVGWILSLCLHEWSHAYVAYLGGDTSVKEKGYLTFNPLRYTDPLMSIILPIIFLLMGGIGLPGGAVYIQRDRLRGKDWDSMVSAAGPISNLILAVLLGLVLHFTPAASTPFGPALAFLALLQVVAVVLNLFPIPPLDGFGIIAPYLGHNAERQIRSFGFMGILLIFLALRIPAINDVFWISVYSMAAQIGVPVVAAQIGAEQFMFWRH